MNETLKKLKELYKDNPDALELIELAKEDIAHIEAQGPDYKGQTPTQYIKTLEATLEMFA